MESNFIKNLKTCISGALGAMSFGIYHQFTTNKIMDLNNKYYEKEINELKDKIK